MTASLIRPALTYLQRYDSLLCDLDGTLMHGGNPIAHAAGGVATARKAQLAIGFVTNNASRSPDQVVAHLAGVGVEAAAHEVMTSPQVAAEMLAAQVPAGSAIMVVGGESLAQEVAAVGLTPVVEDSSDVMGVIQGWFPQLDWARLAEGAYSLRRGVPWIATNTDATLPTEKGMAPGNGSMVAALRHATGRAPQVAGKPEPAMFQQAAERLASTRPLAVGDRLDTDIEGGNRAGIHSLMVLTGVNTALDALHAQPVQRPTWIEEDLRALDHPAPEALVEGDTARCATASATWKSGDIQLSHGSATMHAVRAAQALIARQCPEEPWQGRLLAADGSEITEPSAP